MTGSHINQLCMSWIPSHLFASHENMLCEYYRIISPSQACTSHIKCRRMGEIYFPTTHLVIIVTVARRCLLLINELVCHYNNPTTTVTLITMTTTRIRNSRIHFHYQGLPLITTWISKHVLSRVRDEITYPSLNLTISKAQNLSKFGRG